MPATTRGNNKAAAVPRAASAEPPSPDLPWPEFATPAILALLTGEERKPLRAACRAGRDAVDAGITRLRLRELNRQSNIWGSGHSATSWTGRPPEAARLPALRHLDLYRGGCSFGAQQGFAHMRGAARLVAAQAASLRTLRLSFEVTSCHELPMAAAFLESVLLAAPLPALQRLDLDVCCSPYAEARIQEALRPLSRLSLPRLTRLSLNFNFATGQGVRLLEGAHLPALHHLSVHDYSEPGPQHPCAAALTAPRWSALESLELCVFAENMGGMAALSVALAPTLRHLNVFSWPFGTEGCTPEWPQLRLLEVGAHGILAEQLSPVRLPRLERLTTTRLEHLRGIAVRRAALPALRVVELHWCYNCNNNGCHVVGCTHPETVALLAELRAAWPGLELRRWRSNDWTQA